MFKFAVVNGYTKKIISRHNSEYLADRQLKRIERYYDYVAVYPLKENGKEVNTPKDKE